MVSCDATEYKISLGCNFRKFNLLGESPGYFSDFLPIVGWLDDGIIATILVTEVSQLLVEGLNRRKQTQKATEVNPVDAMGHNQTVVDVSVS